MEHFSSIDTQRAKETDEMDTRASSLEATLIRRSNRRPTGARPLAIDGLLMLSSLILMQSALLSFAGLVQSPINGGGGQVIHDQMYAEDQLPYRQPPQGPQNHPMHQNQQPAWEPRINDGPQSASWAPYQDQQWQQQQQQPNNPRPMEGDRPASRPPNGDAASQLLADLRNKDTCQTLYQGKAHGYEVLEYKVRTKDDYLLTLHRLVHPADMARGGPPRPGTKKPYLLLHGLIGSSSSWLRNVELNYEVPRGEPLDLSSWIERSLRGGGQPSGQPRGSTADQFEATHQDDQSRGWTGTSRRQLFMNRMPQVFASHQRGSFASHQEIYMEEDELQLGKQFKRANRLFELPKETKGYISNSLAFTLSNFGYDVWLLNLRGNKYANKHQGSLTPNQAEFWDFDIHKLIREDLLASINFVRKEAQSARFGPVGLVAYSYSCIHLLGLLTEFPEYQRHLQPVVMMAPTLFTSTGNKRRLLMSLASKLFVSHNGPFPAVGRRAQDRTMKLVCGLPLASKLCHLLEMVLYGQASSVRKLMHEDQKQSMLMQDVACGGTSTGVLHQVVENLSQPNILPYYQPYIGASQRMKRGQKVQRSVMLVHSETDEISNLLEVGKIRDEALKFLTLADYVIHEPSFNHIDFLFSRRNQYLVNGEIAKMVTLFDHLLHS